MNALELLLNRRSIAQLDKPAPTKEVLTHIIHAGMRAPDHGGLQPWRFIIIENEGLERLSHVMQEASIADKGDSSAIQKAKLAPFRAPMIIVVIASCKKNAKVPEWEQIASASCATHAMQMAAIAQGFSGIWRTGAIVDNILIRQAFHCSPQEKIVGFLYLGTPKTKPVQMKTPDYTPFVTWF